MAERTKQCIVCNETKNISGNYRVVNSIKGYTSKTCLSCEQEVTINPIKETNNSSGFIYILFDEAFPGNIKIGYTTNLKRRLRDYNINRPLDTCKYVYTSKLLDNILKVEEKVLTQMCLYGMSIPGRKEWYPIHLKDQLIKEMKSAEVTNASRDN